MKSPSFPLSAAAAALAGALLAGTAAAELTLWYIPAALVLTVAAVFRHPRAMLAAPVFFLCFGVFQLRTALTPRPELGMRPFRAKLRLVVDDARISIVPGIAGGGRFVRSKLRNFASPATGSTLSGADAPVAAVFPEGDAAPRCGTLVEAEGTVSPLAVPDDRDALTERLRRRGVAAIVRIESWKGLGRETGVRSFLADRRDALLTQLFDGVRDAGVRKLAAALYCGVASGIPPEVRESFAAAGIVHVFSVSGIHVAVLALCFAWLLRILPFRTRFAALTALVWIYVLATGAGTPAVRAGAMVTLWALLRTNLLRLRGIDVLCWTATLMLVFDPTLVIDTGAQYSFLITGALLLLAERRSQAARSEWRSVPVLVPNLYAGRRQRLAGLVVPRARAVVLGAATAFLAGAAVSLGSGRGAVGSGAVAANVLLALAMPGFFALFFVQLGFGLCGAGRFTAPMFEWAFRGLRSFAAFFAEHFPDVGAVPPHWSVALLYTAALLAAVGSRRKSVRIAAGTVLVLIVVRQLALPFTLPPALLVHASEHGRPPLVAVAVPARRRAVVANVPDPGSARRAAAFLRARGIREVEIVAASSPDGISAAGVAALGRELAIRNIRLGDPGNSAGLCRVAPLKTGFRLDYFDHGSKLYFGVAVTAGDSGYEAVAERDGKRVRHRLPWSIDREEWVYEFTE